LASDLLQPVSRECSNCTQQGAWEKQQKMLKAHTKEVALKSKLQKASDRLAKEHLLATVEELFSRYNAYFV